MPSVSTPLPRLGPAAGGEVARAVATDDGLVLVIGRDGAQVRLHVDDLDAVVAGIVRAGVDIRVGRPGFACGRSR